MTVWSVVQHAHGALCFVSLTNSLLGLLMYASYFVLFLQLFLSRAPHASHASASHGATGHRPTGLHWAYTGPTLGHARSAAARLSGACGLLLPP